MEHLRDERKRLLKKIADSRRSGTGTYDVFKPTLWWFDAVQFLDVQVQCSTSVDNLPVTIYYNYYYYYYNRLLQIVTSTRNI